MILMSILLWAVVSGSFTVMKSSSCGTRGNTVIERLVDKHVPELSSYKIRCVSWDTNGPYYLKAAPKPSTLWRGGKRRTYEVFINPRIWDDGPSLLAIEAILLHELMHVRDYTQMSSVAVAKFAAKYSLSSKFLRAYEHETDMCVLERAQQLQAPELVVGLALYRAWIYSTLSSEDRRIKRLEYMTPEEIRAFGRARYDKYKCQFGGSERAREKAEPLRSFEEVWKEQYVPPPLSPTTVPSSTKAPDSMWSRIKGTAKRSARYVSQKARSVATSTKRSFVKANQRLTHWHFEGREKRNLKGGPLTFDAMKESDGWRLLPKAMSLFHDNKKGKPELKFVNQDGREAVFDGDTHELIENPLHVGTYNYMDPMALGEVKCFRDGCKFVGKNLGHLIADVVPYALGGNVRGRDKDKDAEYFAKRRST